MLYLIRLRDYPFVTFGKVGDAPKDVRKRLATLQQASPFELELVGVLDGPAYSESGLQHRFRGLRVRRRWYRLEGDLAAYVAAHASPLHVPPAETREAA